MKLSETAKTILSRIQRIEPELDPQIIGYLLLKDYGDREMIRLSFGPDLALEPLINEAKDALSGSFSVPVNAPPEVHPNFASYPPTGSALFSGSAVRVAATPLWDPHIGLEPQIALPNLYLIHGDPSGEDNHGYCGKLLHGSYFQEDPAEGHPMAGSRRRSTSMPELSPRACHYYHRGYCKHGANCRYLHDQLTPGLTPPNSRELGDEDQVIPSWSLEKLELELVDLLKSKKGHPISIATLPSAYMERYGKMLQADGYLTESQRHGKAGFNLTRLLGRLKNSIRILDRPHGQHSVMLVEDALKYMEPGNANNGVGSNVSGSQQIYLTFPSDSSFEEDDVANYFRRFGRVIDVRIPTQHKRMFGFVTFESQETARMVLSEKNPHYICGSRVLVKPYKEKSRNSDRRFSMKSGPYASHSECMDFDLDAYSTRRLYENSLRLCKKHLLVEQDKKVETLSGSVSSWHLFPTHLDQKPFFHFDLDEFRSQIQGEFNDLPCLASDLNSGSLSNNKHSISCTNSDYQSYFTWDVEQCRFLGELIDVSCMANDMNNESISNDKHPISCPNNCH